MNKYKVIIQPEVSEDAVLLCKQLREQALKTCCGGSDAVDRIEYKAATVIEALIRKKLERDGNEL